MDDVDAKSLHAWVDEALHYVAYRLRKEPTHPLQAVVEMVSPTMETLHGARDRFDVSSWFESVHPEDLPRVLAAHLRADEMDSAFDERYRVVVDGEERWVHTVSRPAFDADGAVTHYNGLILDVTSQVVAEQEAREAVLALGSAQRAATAGWIAMGVTHDLNNILQVVQMGCTLALEGADGARQDLLQEVLGAVERGAAVGRRLSGHFRSTSDDLRRIDVAQAVRESCRLFGRSRPNLSIEVQSPSSCIQRTAPVVVEHALLNLLGNAAQAVGGRGQVVVSVASEPGGLRMRVSDDGPGIPPEHRSRVFLPSFSTKGSTGLGLASSRKGIESLGGSLELVACAAGACFELWLPDVEVAEESAEPTPLTITPCRVALRSHGPSADLLRRVVELLGHRVVPDEEAEVWVIDDGPEAPVAGPCVLLDGRPGPATGVPSPFDAAVSKPFRIDELAHAIERARRVGMTGTRTNRGA